MIGKRIERDSEHPRTIRESPVDNAQEIKSSWAFSANNKFYITYSKNDLWSTDGNLNDRKAQYFGKSSAGKFNDGLYGR